MHTIMAKYISVFGGTAHYCIVLQTCSIDDFSLVQVHAYTAITGHEKLD